MYSSIAFLCRPRIELLMIRIMLLTFGMLVVLASLFFVKVFIIEKTKVSVVTANHERLLGIIRLGPATEYFVQQLKESELTPLATAKITRWPFTVSGRMISLNGDNIQVFEYSTNETAMKDALLLAQKYTLSPKSVAWKRNMHVYVNDKLVVFYMGNNDMIIKSLDHNAGVPL